MSFKILLVDDNAVLLDLLACMLMELGHEVRKAPGSDAALTLACSEKFDMALVDNQLGTGSGVDLIVQLKKAAPSLYCVLMTGGPDVDMTIHAVQNGVSDYLRKPFRLEDLVVRIVQMQRRRTREER